MSRSICPLRSATGLPFGAFILLLPAIALADGAAWADKNWPVRRVVAVDAKITPSAGGDEVAVVEIPTDALALPNGGDIRVANSAGRFIPMQLLSVGPGSKARVAFPVQPGKNSYAVYYGNSSPGPLPKEQQLTIRRGLLMDTCTFAGGQAGTYDGALAAFNRARQQGNQGADFVGNVFQGNNLFGPSGRTITRYTGFLQVPAAGDYGFASSSTDASFLLIDGKVAVDWGGYHGWVGDARHNKTLTLTAGVHEFEYLHALIGGEGGCVAAWKPPAAKGWVPIPPDAFLPVFRATLREREKFGAMRSAEMTWWHAGEAAIGGDDEYIQRYRFTSQPTGFDAKTAVFTWDFGDGIAVSSPGLGEYDHVYLLDGPADVTVTVTQGANKETITNRVVIARNWRTIGAAKPDAPASYVNTLQSYDLTRLKPPVLAKAMDVFSRAKSSANYIRAGHILATTTQPTDDKLLTRYVHEYGEFLADNDPDGPSKAASDYLAAAAKAGGPFAKATMFNCAGRILLDRLGNDPKAEQCFQQALKFADRGNDRSIKAAWIGMGDVHPPPRRRGQGRRGL